MQRATAATLLIGGAILLATWLATPASPSPRQSTDSANAASDRSAFTSSDSHVNAQKLSEPVAASGGTNVPVRNPFAYGRDGAASTTSAIAVATAASAAARPALPKLVAILLQNGVRTAVISSGDDVEFVHAGERTGPFVVDRVDADGVLLKDAQTGAAATLSLH